jgi:hypothetical protein
MPERRPVVFPSVMQHELRRRLLAEEERHQLARLEARRGWIEVERKPRRIFSFRLPAKRIPAAG